jgi:Zn-dependent M28 family amino/carboxypeptidase
MKGKQITAIVLIVLFAASSVYVGCKDDTKPKQKERPQQTQEPKQEITAPTFDADTAFSYVKEQVDFGPRVPGSKAHTQCGDYIVARMQSYGATVTEQKTTLKTFEGKSIPVRNIIAAFAPEKKSRVLLCAHWDSRPFGDKDKNQSLWQKPIDGANDGGSGVGVLMEIGRQLSLSPTAIGVDIIFFDAEDLGTAEFAKDGQQEVLNDGFTTSWCLGSQYWGKNKHVENYNARFGILLDMVGAADASFNKEKYSMEFAPDVVNLVWNTASKMGHGNLFTADEVEGVVDDHFFVTRGGIRCVDIIDTRTQIMAMGLGGYTFANYHHTHNDNLSIIDKGTLKAVGQTLMQVIYNQ